MKKYICLGLILFVAFIGCSLVDRDFSLAEEDFPEPGKGALLLVLSGSDLPTKTIAPTGLSMVVDNFKLVFDHTITGEHIEYIESATNGIVIREFTGLTSGEWDVAITAWNGVPGTDDLIGALNGDPLTTITPPIDIPEGGSITIVVGPPDTNETIQPIVGTGGYLNLDLSWPEIAIENTASITALLAGPGGPGDISDDQTGGFTIETATSPNDTATYSSGLMPTGYYLLTMQLFDDSDLAWGWMEAVRIIYTDTPETSSAGWTLDVSAGGLHLTTSWQNPVTFNFSATPPTTLGYLTDKLVAEIENIDPSDPGGAEAYTYRWFLDGSEVFDTGIDGIVTTFELDATDPPLSIGIHNFSALITTSGGALSSETIEITVQ